ncbi:MAG: hypothetical protein LBE35_07450 [Clostridiales bacterium]|jgi:hypothetical protein|nr:hypothetical protein [Clostridiales bacterium]
MMKTLERPQVREQEADYKALYDSMTEEEREDMIELGWALIAIERLQNSTGVLRSHEEVIADELVRRGISREEWERMLEATPMEYGVDFE